VVTCKPTQYTRKRDGRIKSQFTIWIDNDLVKPLMKLKEVTGKGHTTILAEFAEARLRRVKP
jgi:hypothetical protein